MISGERALLRLAAENRERIAELEGQLAEKDGRIERLVREVRGKIEGDCSECGTGWPDSTGVCAWCQRDALAKLLLEIEGGLLGYWTSLPQHVIQDWLPRIRAVLDAPESVKERVG